MGHFLNDYFHGGNYGVNWGITLIILFFTGLYFWGLLEGRRKLAADLQKLKSRLESRRTGHSPAGSSSEEQQWWLKHTGAFPEAQGGLSIPLLGDRLAFVRYPSEIAAKLENNFRWASHLCITLGILGTFIGVLLGLSDPNLGNLDKLSPEELLLPVGALLQGMKTAFGTSVLGMSMFLLCVSIGNYYERIWNRRHSHETTDIFDFYAVFLSFSHILWDVRSSMNRLDPQDMKDAAGKLLTAVNGLNPISKELATASKDLSSAASAITKASSDLSSKIIGQAVGKEVSAALDQSVASHLAPVLVDISRNTGYLESLKKIETIHQDLQIIQSKSLAPLGEAITALSTQSARLPAQISAILSNQTTAVGQMLSSLTDEVPVRIQEKIQEQVQPLRASVDQLNAQTAQSAANLQQMMDATQAALNGQLTSHAHQVDSALVAHTAELRQSSTTFEANIRTAGDRFSQGIDRQDQLLQESARQLSHGEKLQSKNEEQFSSLQSEMKAGFDGVKHIIGNLRPQVSAHQSSFGNQTRNPASIPPTPVAPTPVAPTPVAPTPAVASPREQGTLPRLQSNSPSQIVPHTEERSEGTVQNLAPVSANTVSQVPSIGLSRTTSVPMVKLNPIGNSTAEASTASTASRISSRPVQDMQRTAIGAPAAPQPGQIIESPRSPVSENKDEPKPKQNSDTGTEPPKPPSVRLGSDPPKKGFWGFLRGSKIKD